MEVGEKQPEVSHPAKSDSSDESKATEEFADELEAEGDAADKEEEDEENENVEMK